MRRMALLFGFICFILAGVGSYFAGEKAVQFLEDYTNQRVSETLQASGEDWAIPRSDGLKIFVSGLAPNEASRFKALETIGKVVKIDRVSDEIVVAKNSDIEPPRFSLEMLRNDQRISLIGLIPLETGRDRILGFAQELSQDAEVADMLEIADHPVGQDWTNALQFGLDSLKKLPRSKISVTTEKVVVTAVTESVQEKNRTEKFLQGTKPDNLELVMQISAPRPVISPFTFRLSLKDGKGELSACSADTQFTKSRILRSAEKTNLANDPYCDIGLGVPTTDWARAIELATNALIELEGGVLTFTDSDVALVALDDTSQADFDRIVGDLDNSLPELFSLHAVLPPKIVNEGENGGVDTPEFTATRSPEGMVQLRGRVPNQATKRATDTFARSLFGNENVFLQTRVDENLSGGWPVRILGGLEALSKMHHGSLIVRPDLIEIKGVGERPNVSSDVSRVLAVRIGAKGNYKLDVTFDENLFVVNEEPSPEDCEKGIIALLARQRIDFAPSSARINQDSLKVVTEIADILRKCPNAKFEIEGHTDSQGSAELNLNISQQRAEAVLTALLGQRILTSGITAKGYGAERPIADNNTEEGRATNRRIGFRLITEETTE